MTWKYFFSLKDPIGTWHMIDWNVFFATVSILLFILIVGCIFHRWSKKNNVNHSR